MWWNFRDTAISQRRRLGWALIIKGQFKKSRCACHKFLTITTTWGFHVVFANCEYSGFQCPPLKRTLYFMTVIFKQSVAVFVVCFHFKENLVIWKEKLLVKQAVKRKSGSSDICKDNSPPVTLGFAEYYHDARVGNPWPHTHTHTVLWVLFFFSLFAFQVDARPRLQSLL